MTNKNEDFDFIKKSSDIVMQSKELFAAEIIRTLRVQKLSNVQAAKITGFHRTVFSKIKKPYLKAFTINRLIRILTKLNPEIKISLELI